MVHCKILFFLRSLVQGIFLKKKPGFGGICLVGLATVLGFIWQSFCGGLYIGVLFMDMFGTCMFQVVFESNVDWFL